MRRNWLVLGIGLVSITFVVAGVFAWASRPDTYRDAVGEALVQHQIAYTDLDVREICQPDPSCIVGDGTRTYQTVMVYRDTISYGRVTCYDRRGDCYLNLATFGIAQAPLRDLRGVRMLPRGLAQVVEHTLTHLRALARRAQL
jgi:hypothetical protein